MGTGIPNPSEAAVRKAISREEAARHCRRRTRGVAKTTEMIENLILSLSSATDTLGVPLLKEEITVIWEEQRRHVKCLQDPPEVSLYTISSHINKGGVNLPVYRCSRGSTSLESFHLHMARFIPGTAASAINFQAYLLDGLARWNHSRSQAALQHPHQTLHTFDIALQDRVNTLSRSVMGTDVFPQYRPPAKYTGELYGVEYLYRQNGVKFDDIYDDDKEIDDGFFDIEEDTTLPDMAEDLTTFSTRG